MDSDLPLSALIVRRALLGPPRRTLQDAADLIVAQGVKTTQSTISRWNNGGSAKERSDRVVAAFERAFHLRNGELAEALGIRTVPPSEDITDARAAAEPVSGDTRERVDRLDRLERIVEAQRRTLLALQAFMSPREVETEEEAIAAAGEGIKEMHRQVGVYLATGWTTYDLVIEDPKTGEVVAFKVKNAGGEMDRADGVIADLDHAAAEAGGGAGRSASRRGARRGS